jgi:hypothetical protein
MKHTLTAVGLAIIMALAAVTPASADKPGQPPSIISFDDTTSCGFLVHIEGIKASANFPTAKAGDTLLSLTNPANGKSVQVSTGGYLTVTQNPDGSTSIVGRGGLLWLFDPSQRFHAPGLYVFWGYQTATFSASGDMLSLNLNGGDSINYCNKLS